MKVKLLVAAVCTSLLNINSVNANPDPLWVNVGFSYTGSVWIDQESIDKDKTFVSFDMKLEEAGRTTITSVAAECNTLQFQYQKKIINNISQTVSDSIGQTDPGSVLALPIYYACATYVRQTF